MAAGSRRLSTATKIYNTNNRSPSYTFPISLIKRSAVFTSTGIHGTWNPEPPPISISIVLPYRILLISSRLEPRPCNQYG